jgi:hypothetical protein
MLDANFEIVWDVRVYTQWLNIMEQLVQWEDVLFMSGKIFAHELMLALYIMEQQVFSYWICIYGDAVTSLDTMTSLS